MTTATGSYYSGFRYFRIVCGREYRLVIACRWLIPMTWVVYNEYFPLLGKASVADGGLGWQPQQIGVMLSISGVVMLVFQPIVFPPLTKLLGAVRLHTLGSLGFTLSILTLPLIAPLAELGGSAKASAASSSSGSAAALPMNWPLWAALILQTCVLNCTASAQNDCAPRAAMALRPHHLATYMLRLFHAMMTHFNNIIYGRKNI